MAIDKSYAVFDKMAQFADALNDKATFDSVVGFQNAPDEVQALADAAEKDAKNSRFHTGANLVTATLDSAIAEYKHLHGKAPSGAILHNAVRCALNGVSQTALNRAGVGATFDDAVSISQSDAPLVSTRAAIALYQGVIEAIPFGGYIPMSDALSGKIIVAHHEAGSTTGAYNKNDSLDGIYSGKPFMSHERTVLAQSSDKKAFTALITYVDGDATGAPLIPSATQVLVNGLPAGGAPLNASVADTRAPLSGSIELADKEYTFTGTVTVATGEVAVNFDDALPDGVEVEVVGLINYEHDTMRDKRPVITATARSYDLRAVFTSARYRATQEAKTQWNSEIRLDVGSEAMLTMRQQHAAEKHYNALKSMYKVGKNYVHTANLGGTSRLDARSRADVWADVLFKLTEADQSMLERTNAFGVGVIYVGSKGKAELSALPNTIFEPSGVSSRVGIYRIGRLFGQFDVYFAPNLVNETASSLEMLCIGRSEQTGLNPYILGDVVSPTFLKLEVADDLSEGAGYFYAGAARINPYIKAAQGAAIVAVTGL